MGEIKTSKTAAIFVCVGIGSCIALFLFEPNLKIGGVAHIMLPDFKAFPNISNHAKFANTAPAILIERLNKMGAETVNLRAKIVGGANLFDWSDTEAMADLGNKNSEIVKKELINNKIYLRAQDTGGKLGKTARFNTMSGEVLIKVETGEQRVI